MQRRAINQVILTCVNRKYMKEATTLDAMMIDLLFPSRSEREPQPNVMTTSMREGSENT